MKKSMKKIVSFALMLSLLVGMMAGFNVFAAEEEATVEIVSKNVYYADNLRLMYAVKAPAGAEEVKVNIYNADNELLGEAKLGDGVNVPQKATINDAECFIFVSDFGVPAQEIDTVVYAEAVADGVKSEKVKYSVLEYLYERLVTVVDALADTENPLEEEKKVRLENQKTMYNNLLAYADSLAAVLIDDGQNVDRISEYAYVRVENGTVDGTYSSAMLKAGTKLDSLAKDDSFTVENGKVLGWKINAYEIGSAPTETIIKNDAIAEFAIESGKVYEITPTSIESGAVSVTTASTTIADYAAANGWTEPTKYVTIDLDANVTVTTNGAGNTGKYYTADGGAWRLYQSDNATMTIAAVEGKKIVTVKVAYVVSNTGILALNGVTVESEEEITVNAPSVTFVVGNSGSATNGQARIQSIEVVYTDVPAHDCQFSEATCTEPATCSICGATDGKALGHTYDAGVVTTPAKCTTAGVMTYTCGCGDTYTEDIPATGKHTTDSGVCSECGQQIGGSSTSTITISKTGTEITTLAGATPSNGTSVDGKEAKLDENISVICAKAGAGTAPTYYDPAIRLYQNGATLTVKASNGAKIKTIIITVTDSKGKGPIAVSGGTASALTNDQYTITVNSDTSEIVITTTGTTSSARVYVSNIEVIYEI